MLKIAIVSGGTGSIALQDGFYEVYDKDSIQMDIVINAYDNGKSTGACRKVFDGRILGPSDLRKNQLTQFKSMKQKWLHDDNSRERKIYDLFDLRLSASSAIEYYFEAIMILDSAEEFLSNEIVEELKELVEAFFFGAEESHEEGALRETLEGITFEDFSLSNIFYASCAHKYGNSLATAGRAMARILEIPERVHLISDVNLYLQAATESGHIIKDEEDIVSWGNSKNRITRAILLDESGREYTPSIDEKQEGSDKTVSEIIEQADILILSSGTQWSSLIPTYMHRGFREAVDSSKAKKYLIINNVEDDDMTGVGAEELCSILEEYISIDDFTLVVNENAVSSMNHVCENRRQVRGKYSNLHDRRHIPVEVVKSIMGDYYSDFVGRRTRLFDLDGTLWKSSGHEAEVRLSYENINLFSGIIVSGNSHEHLKEIFMKNYKKEKEVILCADYGNTIFSTSDYENWRYLTEEYFVSEKLPEEIEKIHDFNGKVSMRGGTIITVKPLKNREMYILKIKDVLENQDREYQASVAGYTSIDITRRGYSKALLVQMIGEEFDLDLYETVFVGNEIDNGNEVGIRELGLRALQVDDVLECNVFLRTLVLLDCCD